MEPIDPIRVVVGDAVPVDRDLTRRFLAKGGFRVVSSAAHSDDLVRDVGLMRPDAVVLGETLLDVESSRVIPAIREAFPAIKVALLTSLAADQLGATPDALMDRGVGLRDLPAALKALCRAAAATAPRPLPPRPPAVTVATTAGTTSGPHRAATTEEDAAAQPARLRPLALGLVAVLSALLVVALALDSGSPPDRRAAAPGDGAQTVTATTDQVPPSTDGDATRYLEDAYTELDLMESAIPGGSFAELTNIARDLIRARDAAAVAGADVSELNSLIAQTLAPLIEGVTPRLAWALRGILGSLVPVPDFGLGGTSLGGSIEDLLEDVFGNLTGDLTSEPLTLGRDLFAPGPGAHDRREGGDGPGGEPDPDPGPDPGPEGDGLPGNGNHRGWDTEPRGNGNHYGWVNKPPDGGWHGEDSHDHEPPGRAQGQGPKKDKG